MIKIRGNALDHAFDITTIHRPNIPRRYSQTKRSILNFTASLPAHSPITSRCHQVEVNTIGCSARSIYWYKLLSCLFYKVQDLFVKAFASIAQFRVPQQVPSSFEQSFDPEDAAAARPEIFQVDHGPVSVPKVKVSPVKSLVSIFAQVVRVISTRLQPRPFPTGTREECRAERAPYQRPSCVHSSLEVMLPAPLVCFTGVLKARMSALKSPKRIGG